mmetsp:Transcript_31440/g.94047  ORF Transcript_31440/g.94047 Transcript_31440/m.94047 type:complete len:108 (+) Transcript_31440:1863-2186(+)
MSHSSQVLERTCSGKVLVLMHGYTFTGYTKKKDCIHFHPVVYSFVQFPASATISDRCSLLRFAYYIIFRISQMRSRSCELVLKCLNRPRPLTKAKSNKSGLLHQSIT